MDPFFYDFTHLQTGTTQLDRIGGDMDYVATTSWTNITDMGDGGYSFHCAGADVSNTLRKALPSGIRRTVIGCSIKKDATTTAVEFMSILDVNATRLMSVGWSTSGLLQVYGPSGVLVTLAPVIASGVEQYVELIVYVDSTAGTWEVRVDGEVPTDGSGTGINTGNADIRWGQWHIRSPAGTACDIRRLYLKEWTDDENPDQYGPIVMLYLPLTADVGTPDWTPDTGGDCTARIARRYDSSPAGGYMQTDTAADEATFVFTNTPTGTTSLIAVVPVMVCSAPYGGAPLVRCDLESSDEMDVVEGPLRTMPVAAATRLYPIFTAPDLGPLTKAAVDDANLVIVAVG